MKVSPARYAAFKALQKIENRSANSGDILPEVESPLTEKDRSLCHEIVLGVLRRQIYLDRLFAPLVGGNKLDLDVRIALEMGAYQLLFLDRIPAHAAINESVDLVKKARKSSAAGLVNAVLRKISSGVEQPKPTDELDRISIETSHPRHLLERWAIQFGVENAALLAEAGTRAPKLCFRPINARSREEMAAVADAEDIVKSELVPASYRAEKLTARMRELDADGKIYFQDEGSQMVAYLASTYAKERLLDVCGAPGSKTTAIALYRPDITIVAGDNSPRRIEILQQIIERSSVKNVSVVLHDAEKGLISNAGNFDTVLVDAPCTGTGTIRHNPEIKFRAVLDEITRSSDKQLRILKSASECVCSDGVLIYSTCSLEREENEDVIERFLAETPYFKIEVPDKFAHLAESSGGLRTFPHRDDMDGFFVAVMRRKDPDEIWA